MSAPANDLTTSSGCTSRYGSAALTFCGSLPPARGATRLRRGLVRIPRQLRAGRQVIVLLQREPIWVLETEPVRHLSIVLFRHRDVGVEFGECRPEVLSGEQALRPDQVPVDHAVRPQLSKCPNRRWPKL